MKAIIADREALSAIRPIDMIAYLRARGWSAFATDSDSPTVDWHKGDGDGYIELQVPRHTSFRDYPHRVQEVLQTLAKDEQKSQLDVFRDIPLVARDIIRLRTLTGGRDDGTIALSDGALLSMTARGMMLAAACSTVEPRRAYHTRKPAMATAYLDQVSLGQTEHGSYVMTILSPVTPAYSQATFPFDDSESLGDEPFNRRVTTTLGFGLRAIRSAAESVVATGNFAAFEEGVTSGVSADLCESLSLAVEHSAIRSLTITIGWASARPPHSPPPSSHEFSPDYLEVIREGGRYLREHTPREDFDVEGVVVDVERPGNEILGRVVILGSIDGHARKLRCQLTDNDWTLATFAMQHRAAVRCRGELVREGRLWWLRNARDFRVLSED